MSALPPAECPLGYPDGQVRAILGGRLDDFNHWMRGQTVARCEGRRYDYATKEYVADDLVVGSLNFGSGFLYSEDVELLREIAVVIGVNPMEATPSEFTNSYAHPFDDRTGRQHCWYCGLVEDVPIHHESAQRSAEGAPKEKP